MARRPGLGRGLEALITSGDQDQQTHISRDGILQISVDKISPNPRQPRETSNLQDLEDLAGSIRAHGIIQPLIVSRSEIDAQYTLIAGERRWRAAILAGLETVPAIVRTVTQQEQLELALIENLQREDLNPLERAEAYQHLVDDFSLTHERIADRVGKSRVSITNTLRLLNLSEKARAALVAGEISEGHARALLALTTPHAQDAALQTVINLNLNVRQAEVLVNKLLGKKPATNAPLERPVEIRDLEDRLRAFFKTKVNLQPGKKGGTITVFYYSDEELNAILDRLAPLE